MSDLGDTKRDIVSSNVAALSTPQARYDAYMLAFNGYHAENPEQREGQAHFNVLYFGGFDPEFADSIRGGPLDPFYDDGRLPAYFEALRGHWDV